MRRLQLREAKAALSAVVDAAERGEATTITRHGRPAAVVVPVVDADRLYAETAPDFAELLLSIPASFDTTRSRSRLRKVRF
jgi:prevent-host-death family protein